MHEVGVSAAELILGPSATGLAVTPPQHERDRVTAAKESLSGLLITATQLHLGTVGGDRWRAMIDQY
jgi:hypothetical protein